MSALSTFQLVPGLELTFVKPNHLYTHIWEEFTCMKTFSNMVQAVYLVVDCKTIDRIAWV